MPSYGGVRVSIIAQVELTIFPEFKHPETSQFTYRNTQSYPDEDRSPEDAHAPAVAFESKADKVLGRESAVSVYIPSARKGTRFWIRFDVLRPLTGPLGGVRYYFCKLVMNGRLISSWGVDARTQKSVKIMRGLFDPSAAHNYRDESGQEFKACGVESRGFYFHPSNDSNSPAKDGGIIEVQVFRARGREQIVQEPAEVRDEEEYGKEYGIKLVSDGLVDAPQDSKFYNYSLVDQKNKPFAHFKFHYRTWDSLVALNLVPEEHPRGLIKPSPSLQSLYGLSRKMQDELDEANFKEYERQTNPPQTPGSAARNSLLVEAGSATIRRHSSPLIADDWYPNERYDSEFEDTPLKKFTKRPYACSEGSEGSKTSLALQNLPNFSPPNTTYDHSKDPHKASLSKHISWSDGVRPLPEAPPRKSSLKVSTHTTTYLAPTGKHCRSMSEISVNPSVYLIADEYGNLPPSMTRREQIMSNSQRIFETPLRKYMMSNNVSTSLKALIPASHLPSSKEYVHSHKRSLSSPATITQATIVGFDTRLSAYYHHSVEQSPYVCSPSAENQPSRTNRDPDRVSEQGEDDIWMDRGILQCDTDQDQSQKSRSTQSGFDPRHGDFTLYSGSSRSHFTSSSSNRMRILPLFGINEGILFGNSRSDRMFTFPSLSKKDKSPLGSSSSNSPYDLEKPKRSSSISKTVSQLSNRLRGNRSSPLGASPVVSNYDSSFESPAIVQSNGSFKFAVSNENSSLSDSLRKLNSRPELYCTPEKFSSAPSLHATLRRPVDATYSASLKSQPRMHFPPEYLDDSDLAISVTGNSGLDFGFQTRRNSQQQRVQYAMSVTNDNERQPGLNSQFQEPGTVYGDNTSKSFHSAPLPLSNNGCLRETVVAVPSPESVVPVPKLQPPPERLSRNEKGLTLSIPPNDSTRTERLSPSVFPRGYDDKKLVPKCAPLFPFESDGYVNEHEIKAAGEAYRARELAWFEEIKAKQQDNGWI